MELHRDSTQHAQQRGMVLFKHIVFAIADAKHLYVSP
jgi:hypothetical protein